MLCDTISHKLLSPMIDMVENYYHDLLLHLTNIQQFELQTKLMTKVIHKSRTVMTQLTCMQRDIPVSMMYRCSVLKFICVTM